ncbi:histone deacetylase complex subunit SAP25 [Sigmodon hispidus]
MEEPGTPAQHSPQPRALGPPESPRKPPCSDQASGPTAGAPAPPPPPPPPRGTSRVTPLPLWDPSPEAQLLGPSCGSGRTLCHPSWPMYDAWGRIPAPGQPEDAVCRDAGLPVTSYEDVFLLDPLLPCGQRIPLCLSKPPQQAMGSRKLLLPPPIMSSSVHPSSPQTCSSAWLTEAEMIALAGLLQMSQGELRSNPLAGPLPSTSCPDPVSVAEEPGPSGGQNRLGSTEPCPTQTPDTHCS